MNWKEIIVSDDNRGFLYLGKKVFDKDYIEVLKFHAPGLAPVNDESGSFHIDVKGNPLYPERYSRTFGYYCNRAAVIDGKNWFHLTDQGDVAYPRTFKWTGNFQEDICTVRNEKNQYFHIKLNGEKLYEETYIYAGDFKDGIACVKQDNGKFKHINSTGKNLNATEFLDIGIFHKNFATAKDEGGWFHIYKSGTALYSARYLMVEPFYNGFALVTKLEGEKVIIDEEGKVILEI
jgi:hypothetical protein